MTQVVRVIFVAALAAILACASALVLPPQQQSRRLTVVAAKTPLSANGKKIEVPEGSSMMAACKKLGINVPTSCKKGAPVTQLSMTFSRQVIAVRARSTSEESKSEPASAKSHLPQSSSLLPRKDWLSSSHAS